MPNRSSLTIALMAAGAALALAAPAARAQDNYDQQYGPGYYGPNEDVEVIAPRFHEQSRKLNGPLEKVSLSTRVRYSDLDLADWRDAQELRYRVRSAAHDMCAQLADAYPVYQLNGTSCIRDAVRDGLVRADRAIKEARFNAREYGRYERAGYRY